MIYGDCTEMSAACEESRCCSDEVNFLCNIIKISFFLSSLSMTRSVYAYLGCLGVLQVMLVSYGDCTEMSAACEGSRCCGGEINFQVISSIYPFLIKFVIDSTYLCLPGLSGCIACDVGELWRLHRDVRSVWGVSLLRWGGGRAVTFQVIS